MININIKELSMRVRDYLIKTISIIAMLIICNSAHADISGVPGVQGAGGPGPINCPPTYDTLLDLEGPINFANGGCILRIPSDNYAPYSQYYQIRTYVNLHAKDVGWANSSDFSVTGQFYLDATKPISEQPITVYGGTGVIVPYSGSFPETSICYLLASTNGTLYQFSAQTPQACQFGGHDPLPPVPPGVTTCKINHGNQLDVDLNTVERAKLPVVPGTGDLHEYTLPVDCDGGDVTVSMQIKFIPISMSGTEVVQTTFKGLGVAVIYNDKVTSTTDTTTINFLKGSNSLNLSFEAVRDPAVGVGDIPTGPFTASATVVMTEQ